MNRKNLIFILSPVIIFFAGCNKNPSNPVYQKEVTVFGYLWGNEPMDAEHAISITYSQPLDQVYNHDNAAIHNAEVTLTDSATGDSWILRDSNIPGRYFNDDVMIQPNTTYQLRIVADDILVVASTTVPPPLTLITNLSTDTINTESQMNLGYRNPVMVQCDGPDDQMILVDMFCLVPWEEAEYLNPFFGQKKPQSKEEYDSGINGEPRHIQAFVSYQDLVAPDFNNDHVIYWYASMIVFYGHHTMQIMTVDDNYMEYQFDEHPVYSGGIQGGIGLFASMCGSTYILNITDK